MGSDEEKKERQPAAKEVTISSKPRMQRVGKSDSPRIVTTKPSELRRHNISDEELEMLKQNSTDGMSEIFWGLAGAACAAAPSALETIWKAYIEKPNTPISVLHLVEIGIVLLGAGGAVLVKLLSRGRGVRLEKLITGIRSRTAD